MYMDSPSSASNSIILPIKRKNVLLFSFSKLFMGHWNNYFGIFLYFYVQIIKKQYQEEDNLEYFIS